MCVWLNSVSEGLKVLTGVIVPPFTPIWEVSTPQATFLSAMLITFLQLAQWLTVMSQVSPLYKKLATVKSAPKKDSQLV